jgi:hypothetical protein
MNAQPLPPSMRRPGSCIPEKWTAQLRSCESREDRSSYAASRRMAGR